MGIYRLQHFPAACVHCLRPLNEEETFASIDDYNPALECTVGQKSAQLLGDLNSKSVDFAEICDLLPKQICHECLEVIIVFHQYQSNLKCVRLFSAGLASLLRSNAAPLTELYNSQRHVLAQVLKSLDICHGPEEEITVQKLLEEISLYKKDGREEKESGCSVLESHQSDDLEDQLSKEQYQESGSSSVFATKMKGRRKVNHETMQKMHILNAKLRVRKRGRPRKYHTGMELGDSARRWKCQYDFCEETFPDRTTMRKHARVDHKTFECLICGYVRPYYSQYKRHMDRHIRSHLFVCDYCNAEHATKQELVYHLKTVHIVNPEMECQCGVCGMLFRGKQHLHRHMRSHNTERNYVCDVCSMSFKNSTHLKRHSNVHQDWRYQCKLCDMSYGRRDKVRAHLELAHNIQSYFHCDICLVTFEADDLLQQHMERHRNPKSLECGTCLRVYLREENFQDHVCITYQESYECCGKDFRHHSFYNKHMITDHGVVSNIRVKPPKDKLLSQYRKTRAAPKSPITCDYCSENFESKFALNRHQKTCCTNLYDSSIGTESLSIELLSEIG